MTSLPGLHPGDAMPVETATGRVVVDLAVGHLRGTVLRHAGRDLHPLHAAPWVEDGTKPTGPDAGLAVVSRLSGDFLCAPFGGGNHEVPPHGWPASSRWVPAPELAGDNEVACMLERDVYGAQVTKWVGLAPDAPLLYQRHTIVGGQGRMPVGHHAMTRVSGKGRLSCSPKASVHTVAKPLSGDRQFLAYPATGEGIHAAPAADGGTIDLRDYPPDASGDDMLTLVEQAKEGLGWTALVRHDEDDIVFIIKDVATFPVTMLWMSHGGRDEPPWSARHTGVLGIMDGVSCGDHAHATCCGDNPLSARGVPTCVELAPDRVFEAWLVIGAVRRPAGWEEVSTMSLSAGTLVLGETKGQTLALPVTGMGGHLEEDGCAPPWQQTP